MFWFNEFNGIYMPPAEFNTGIPRAFAQNRIGTTGGEGEYDLDGTRNPMTQQSYTHEISVAACDFQAKWDELLSMARTSGTLKKTNGSVTRQTRAKISNIADATTVEDWARRSKRIGIQFSAEPYWYSDEEVSVNFTSALYVSLRNTPNAGNTRAVKYVVLTITSNIASSLIISVEPNTPIHGGSYYGEFKYGTRVYGQDTSLINSGLTYNAAMYGTLVIDAGNGTVTVNGVDAYANTVRPDTQMALLWLEPGDNIIRFSSAATGNITFRSAWI